MSSSIKRPAGPIEPRLIGIRRDPHARPELAFGEVRTARVVAAGPARLGMPLQERVGRAGVMDVIEDGDVIEGGQPGPVPAIAHRGVGASQRGRQDRLPGPSDQPGGTRTGLWVRALSRAALDMPA